MTRNVFTDNETVIAPSLNAIKHAHDGEGVVNGSSSSTGAGSFDVDVDSGAVALNDSRASVTADTVTHDTSDPNDRIDLITVNETDSISITKGSEDTTSADGNKPVAPDIPSNEVLLAPVHVRGGSSEIRAGDILDKNRVVVREAEDLTTNGTADNVLTAQSDGSTAMDPLGRVPLDSVTASSQSTIDLTTGLDTTQSVFVLSIDHLVPSQDAGLALRTSTDGGSNFDSGSSDYEWSVNLTNTNGGTSDGGQPGTSEINLSGGLTVDSTGYFNATCRIYNPADKNAVTAIDGTVTFIDNSNTRLFNGNVGGDRNAAEANDALRITTLSGNIASGTARLWGLTDP